MAETHRPFCDDHKDTIKKIDETRDRLIRLEQVVDNQFSIIRRVTADINTVQSLTQNVQSQLAALPTKIIATILTTVAALLAILHNLPVLSKLLS